MTAAGLLTDPEFRGFCSHWREHGRCPLPFADFLRDKGMDAAADAAEWAALEPDRADFGGHVGSPGGVCPNDIGCGFAWGRGPRLNPGCRQYLPRDVWGAIPTRQFATGRWSGGETFAGAIAAFLDAWALARPAGVRA